MYISVTKKVGALDAWAHERVSEFFFFEHSEIGQGGGFSFGWLQTWPDYVYLYNTIDSHFVFTSWEKKPCMVGERGGLKSGDDEEGSMGGEAEYPYLLQFREHFVVCTYVLCA